MTTETLRLIQNLRHALAGFNVEQLYQLAVGLRHELARRQINATPEADSLVAALLAHARIEHAAIFSADCSPFGPHSCGAAYYGGGPHAPDCPAAEKS